MKKIPFKKIAALCKASVRSYYTEEHKAELENPKCFNADYTRKNCIENHRSNINNINDRWKKIHNMKQLESALFVFGYDEFQEFIFDAIVGD